MNGDFLVLVGAPILRGVAGWAQNALADGKVSLLEWRRLLKTLLRLGVPAFALFFGFNMDIEIAVSLPIIADYIFDYFVKFVRKNK